MNFCNVQHFVSDVPTKKAKSLEVRISETDFSESQLPKNPFLRTYGDAARFYWLTSVTTPESVTLNEMELLTRDLSSLKPPP